tara:strand:- start:564 stop:689 length:126 start_codon:yes stop_codon:yes gene_type:complete
MQRSGGRQALAALGSTAFKDGTPALAAVAGPKAMLPFPADT